MVILLALREFEQSGVHMKVFSQLARKLMSEEFRSLLMSIEDPSELIIKIRSELGGDF
jgi:mannitol/fructose-specific phosphotransferase system IIA component (Ntr-type)